jgi:hypothetical protein
MQYINEWMASTHQSHINMPLVLSLVGGRGVVEVVVAVVVEVVVVVEVEVEVE